MQLAPRAYDISSAQVSFNNIAAQIVGTGITECGNVNGWNANLSGFSETARGSWIRAGSTSFRGLTFSGGNARGSFIDRVGFVQTHPNPVSGWSPTAYDYLIENVNSLGGLKIGPDVMFLGINKGIICDNSGRLELRHFQGQFYTEGLYLDRALDTTFIPSAQIYTFNGLPNPVAAWQAANTKILRLFRCDGIMGGSFFALGVNMAMELNQNANGFPTDISFQKFWADVSKYGIYNNAGNARVTIDDFVSQGESIVSGNGSPLAGSYGYYGTGLSGGGIITFGNCRFERYAGAGISKGANATVVVKGVTRSIVHSGAKVFQTASGMTPIRVAAPFPLIDDNSGPYGVQGVDYVVPSNDQRFNYTATVSASGTITVNHGLGNNGVWGLRGAFAVCKGNSGEAVPMAFTGMDGTAAGFSVSNIYSGRQARVALIVSSETPSSW
jgi:hypothetical protein